MLTPIVATTATSRNVRRGNVALRQVLRERVLPVARVVDAPAAAVEVAVALLTEGRAAVKAARTARLALRLFDILVIEGRAVEADAAKEHGFVDVLGLGDLVEDAGRTLDLAIQVQGVSRFLPHRVIFV